MLRGKSKVYDAFARNPVFSGSEKAIPWELMKLAGHFHPSVSQFAEKILTGKTIMYDGNPLDDFTIMKFLNRFVYKNPKSRSETAAAPFEKKAAVSIDQAPVNSSKLLTLPQDSIPMDVQFFHKYFSEKKELAEKKKEQARERRLEEGEVGSDDDSGASSVADEEFEEFMEEELDNLMEEVDSDDAAETSVQREQRRRREQQMGVLQMKRAKMTLSSQRMTLTQSDVDEGGDREKGTFAVVKGNNEDEPEFDEEALQSRMMKTKVETRKRRTEKTEKEDETTTVGEDPELQDNADKFSSLIDENVSAKFDHMTMEALSNKDNANRKQLKWEMDRHKWIKGRDTKSIIAAKKSGNKRHRWFSKKGKGGKPKGNKK
ncbi:putative CCAAT/enhancer-binding protein zeta [Apostichopus japonicus]|uniref:Putative CCAAT/enhancer-binding protein zeta n=1 Tax=Stichopus japonicus TaxID=307972 RepID=A0A2G8JG28_STIJA|nr:putative CCAAT/enhancer-binding protein zeta [Apostichopus japonicus]